MDAPTLDAAALGLLLDRAATETPAVSTYCSAADWGLGAQLSLHRGRQVILSRDQDHVFAVSVGQEEGGPLTIRSLESDWGFGSPLLGRDPDVAARLAVATLGAIDAPWKIAVLTGLSSDQAVAFLRQCKGRFRAVRRDGIVSAVARIDDGLEGYLARRAPKWRSNSRREERRAAQAGYEFEVVPGDADSGLVLARAHAVEARSWKTAAGAGMLASESFREFYHHVLARASSNGRLRAVFARQGGEDRAFVFGARLGTTYRGFQLGYEAGLESYGLGNLVQRVLIESLAAEGVEHYDLGMDMAYKRRWAEGLLRLDNVLVAPDGR